MSELTNKIMVQLTKDPVSVALMLTDEQLEETIAAFVSVLNRRKHNRGDKKLQAEY